MSDNPYYVDKSYSAQRDAQQTGLAINSVYNALDTYNTVGRSWLTAHDEYKSKKQKAAQARLANASQSDIEFIIDAVDKYIQQTGSTKGLSSVDWGNTSIDPKIAKDYMTAYEDGIKEARSYGVSWRDYEPQYSASKQSRESADKEVLSAYNDFIGGLYGDNGGWISSNYTPEQVKSGFANGDEKILKEIADRYGLNYNAVMSFHKRNGEHVSKQFSRISYNMSEAYGNYRDSMIGKSVNEMFSEGNMFDTLGNLRPDFEIQNLDEAGIRSLSMLKGAPRKWFKKQGYTDAEIDRYVKTHGGEVSDLIHRSLRKNGWSVADDAIKAEASAQKAAATKNANEAEQTFKTQKTSAVNAIKNEVTNSFDANHLWVREGYTAKHAIEAIRDGKYRNETVSIIAQKYGLPTDVVEAALADPTTWATVLNTFEAEFQKRTDSVNSNIIASLKQIADPYMNKNTGEWTSSSVTKQSLYDSVVGAGEDVVSYLVRKAVSIGLTPEEAKEWLAGNTDTINTIFDDITTGAIEKQKASGVANIKAKMNMRLSPKSEGSYKPLGLVDEYLQKNPNDFNGCYRYIDSIFDNPSTSTIYADLLNTVGATEDSISEFFGSNDAEELRQKAYEQINVRSAEYSRSNGITMLKGFAEAYVSDEEFIDAEKWKQIAMLEALYDRNNDIYGLANEYSKEEFLNEFIKKASEGALSDRYVNEYSTGDLLTKHAGQNADWRSGHSDADRITRDLVTDVAEYFVAMGYPTDVAISKASALGGSILNAVNGKIDDANNAMKEFYSEKTKELSTRMKVYGEQLTTEQILSEYDINVPPLQVVAAISMKNSKEADQKSIRRGLSAIPSFAQAEIIPLIEESMKRSMVSAMNIDYSASTSDVTRSMAPASSGNEKKPIIVSYSQHQEALSGANMEEVYRRDGGNAPYEKTVHKFGDTPTKDSYVLVEDGDACIESAKRQGIDVNNPFDMMQYCALWNAEEEKLYELNMHPNVSIYPKGSSEKVKSIIDYIKGASEGEQGRIFKQFAEKEASGIFEGCTAEDLDILEKVFALTTEDGKRISDKFLEFQHSIGMYRTEKTNGKEKVVAAFTLGKLGYDTRFDVKSLQYEYAWKQKSLGEKEADKWLMEQFGIMDKKAKALDGLNVMTKINANTYKHEYGMYSPTIQATSDGRVPGSIAEMVSDYCDGDAIYLDDDCIWLATAARLKSDNRPDGYLVARYNDPTSFAAEAIVNISENPDKTVYSATKDAISNQLFGTDYEKLDNTRLKSVVESQILIGNVAADTSYALIEALGVQDADAGSYSACFIDGTVGLLDRNIGVVYTFGNDKGLANYSTKEDRRRVIEARKFESLGDIPKSSMPIIDSSKLKSGTTKWERKRYVHEYPTGGFEVMFAPNKDDENFQKFVLDTHRL